MKKILIVGTALFAAVSFAYAEDVNVNATAETAAPTEVQQKPPFQPKPLVKSMMVRSQIGSIEGKGFMVAGGGTKATMTPTFMGATTGDPATDEQLKVLRKEFELKMKALVEEYEAKAKIVIGDKKIKMVLPPVQEGIMMGQLKSLQYFNEGLASGTPEQRPSTEADFRARIQNASGTFPMMGGVNTEDFHAKMQKKMDEIRKRMQNPDGVSPTSGTGNNQNGQVSAIQNFFQSLFGGNAVEAQAQGSAQ